MTDAKNVIYILTPFEACNILAALQLLRSNDRVPTKSMNEAINTYIRQSNDIIDQDQLDDVHAEYQTRKILNKHY